MKKTLYIGTIILTAGLLSMSLLLSADDFRWKFMEADEHHSNGVAMVTNSVYAEECGSCHMAYPPGLLPASSWNRLMTGLEDHFGDNAELDKSTQQLIMDYLRANNAAASDFRRSRKFSRGIPAGDNAPIRITDTPYFKHEHDEIPVAMVFGNPEVKSFSHCNACHTRAEQGLFNEHDIHIPHYGRWDD